MSIDLEELEASEEDTEMEEVPTNKILAKLQKELPFVFKIINKIPLPSKKKREIITENDIDGAIDKIDLEDSKKPKKKIKVIHIVIIAALAMLVLFGEDEEVAPVKLEPIKKTTRAKKITKPEEVKDIVEKDPIVDEKIDDSLNQPTNDSLDNIDLGDLSELESEPIAEDPIEKEPEAIVVDEEEPIISDPVSEPVDISVDLDVEDKEEPAEIVKDIEVKQAPVVDLPDIPNLEFNDNLNSDIVIDESENKMTELILKELEKDNAAKSKVDLSNVKKPTDAPHYLSSGQNLVYNCVGGHWACVDKIDFKICKDHYAWNLKNAKPTSCYPERDYENSGECEAIQQYKINTVYRTDFCN